MVSLPKGGRMALLHTEAIYFTAPNQRNIYDSTTIHAADKTGFLTSKQQQRTRALARSPPLGTRKA